MNQAIVTGLLIGEPQAKRGAFGHWVYWFFLTVQDHEGGKTEIVEVVGAEATKSVLRHAVENREQIIVHGAIHTCEGSDLDRPGKHRFILAEQIAPFTAANYTVT